MTTNYTEEQVFEILEDIYADQLAGGGDREEVFHLIDLWLDKNGSILIEGRGMQPLDGVVELGYVDHGEVTFI